MTTLLFGRKLKLHSPYWKGPFLAASGVASVVLISALTACAPLVYVHDLNPFALKITASFGIRWYALAYLFGFFATYLLVRWFAKRGFTPLAPQAAGDFVFAAAVGTIIGGRLGYCLFYSPELFSQITSSPPFWGVLAINHGGMASHGGIIGIVLACVWFARSRGIPAAHAFDLCALSGTIGVFFGRIANFVNGELVGRPAPDWLPWAVKFPQDIYQWSSVQLRALGPAAEAAGIKLSQWNEWLNIGPYNFAAQAQVEAALARIIAAVQHGSILVRNALAPHLIARHPSQIYEALGEGLFLFIVLFLMWRVPRKPGVISGWFLVLYALVRIAGEQFRMPDAHIGFQMLGATRGQILSALMLVIGVICLRYWSRAAGAELGGWGRPRAAADLTPAAPKPPRLSAPE